MTVFTVRRWILALTWSAILLAGSAATAQSTQPAQLSVDWGKIIGTTRTTITLQVVENPPISLRCIRT